MAHTITSIPNSPIDEDNNKRSVLSKSHYQPQGSTSSNSSYKPFINADSSGSLPSTPQTATTRKNAYESDSSDEGRVSQQRLGLRVANPDTSDDLDVDTTLHTYFATKVEPIEAETTNSIRPESPKMAIMNDFKGGHQLSSSVLVTPIRLSQSPVPKNNETEWRVSLNLENKHNMPSQQDQQQMVHLVHRGLPLQRRESKTLSAADEVVHKRTNKHQGPEETNKNNHNLHVDVLQDINKHEYVQQEITGSISCHTSSDNCSATDTVTNLPTAAPKTTDQLLEYARNHTSRYDKVSYHLTNDPTAIKRYREMAEKGNDTTTQLIFAKYLLETANTFYPPHAPNAPPKIVGSLWGIGATTKKSLKPEPFLVVPSPDDGSSVDPSTVSNHSFKSPSITGTDSLRSSLVPSSKDASLSINQHTIPRVAGSSVLDESKKQKIKALEDEGVKWIKRLSKQNVGEACYMLANWMDKDLYGFKQNKSKSMQLHQIAARSNIPESVFQVAQYYEEEGKLAPGRIIKLYRSAVDNGYVNAIYKMALITMHGRLGVRQSLVGGLKLMHEACTLCSEEFNEPLVAFAQMLTNDYKDVDLPSTLTDPYGGKEAAILYYERAARLNNDKAQSELGSIYEHGRLGESMNFARAYDYYSAAAVNGNTRAMLGLCRLHNRGSHGPGDTGETDRLENDVSGWLAATPINEDLSFSWCEQAAKANNPDGLALLGWFYEIGFGVPRDFDQTKKYYQMAASLGHTSAKSKLANMNSSITKHQHDKVVQKSLNTNTSRAIIEQPHFRASRATRDNDVKKNNCRCM